MRSTCTFRGCAALAAICLSLCGFSQALQASDLLLDNTADGVATLNNVAGTLLSSTDIKQGLQFDIGSGYSTTLLDVLLGLQSGNVGFDLELWSWDGDTSSASLLGSQSFVAPSDALGYYTFDLTDPVFSNLASGSYLLTLSSETNVSTVVWRPLNPAATPVSDTPGFDFVQYRRSTDGGTTWGSTSLQNSIRLTGLVVPEPSTFVLCGLGVATLGLARRRKS